MAFVARGFLMRANQSEARGVVIELGFMPNFVAMTNIAIAFCQPRHIIMSTDERPAFMFIVPICAQARHNRGIQDGAGLFWVNGFDFGCVGHLVIS